MTTAQLSGYTYSLPLVKLVCSHVWITVTEQEAQLLLK